MDLTSALNLDNSMITSPIAHMHEFYLSGSIGPAEEYTNWFTTMRHAGTEDIVKIYINSEGGHLLTAVQFLRVLTDCRATVIVSIEGSCMSAATMIMLAADAYEISPHTLFMFHDYSGGLFGSGTEMYKQVTHERAWSDRMLREIYRDFLTLDEIDKILNNDPIWMDADTVLDRLRARADKLEEEAEEFLMAEPEKKKAKRTKKKEFDDG